MTLTPPRAEREHFTSLPRGSPYGIPSSEESLYDVPPSFSKGKPLTVTQNKKYFLTPPRDPGWGRGKGPQGNTLTVPCFHCTLRTGSTSTPHPPNPVVGREKDPRGKHSLDPQNEKYFPPPDRPPGGGPRKDLPKVVRNIRISTKVDFTFNPRIISLKKIVRPTISIL